MSQFFIQFCLIFVSIVFFTKYYLDKRRIFQLGSKLPGPKPWPVIGNALDFLGADLDILGIVNRINKKYGGLAAAWLGHQLNVFVCTPEYAEIYFTSSKLFNRSFHVKFLEPALGESLISARGAKWRKIRKFLEPSFRMSTLKSYIPVMSQQSDILVKNLEKTIGKTSFSLLPFVKNCTFDIITETTMEMKLKSQETEVKVLENSDKLLELIGRRMYKVWLYPDLLFKMSQTGKEFYSRVNEVKNFANEKLKAVKMEYEETKKLKTNDTSEHKLKKSTLAHQLLSHEEWTDDEIIDHALTIITTGYDTSALSVCYALVLLGLHPAIQEKLYDQIRSVLEDESVDDGLQNLQYLDMVVKETLRLYPIATILFREADEDVQMGEYLIPKGASVSINLYTLHRDPSQYEDPNKFNPDNFLPENVRKRHPYSYCPFGGGLRKCIGYKFAIMSMKIMLGKILQRYKVECDYKSEDDLELRFNISTRPKDGFKIRLLKR